MPQPEQLDREMDEAIARYEKAKANGTLDEEFPVLYKIYKDELPYTHCPLTNSSHEKALVRVVEKELTGGTEPISINVYKYKQDFIQVLCSCGHIISEAEIKSK